MDTITRAGPRHDDESPEDYALRASEESRVGGFKDSAEGMWITNPFVSQCLRFPVTPQRYGFEVTHTGGGNEAWVRDEGPDLELWITGLDGDAATCDCRGWIMGLYYMGNDEQEPIWCMTVGADGNLVRDIDIADPDPRDAKLGGIETVANDYRRTTLEELRTRLKKADFEIVCAAEAMTGRDTYPLIDESASPFELYVCIEIERLLGSIRHLTDNIHNEITTIEISA